MKNRTILLGILTAGFLSGLQTPAFSDTAGIDPRDIALDKALGGMKEGSRILSPHGDIHAGGQHMHGTPGSHVGSAAETHHPAVSATAPGPSPAATEAGSPLGATEANHGVFAHGSSGNETGLVGSSQESTGANIGIEKEILPGGDTGAGGSSGGSQEPTMGGGSEASIIEVTADANLDTDNPSTSGDVAINPDAGGGLLDANTETTANTGSQETTSGTSSNEHSIIETNAGADLSGGSPTVEAEVTIDPNASGGLVDAEATTSTDVIEQELTSSTGLQVDVGTDTATAETTTVATETGRTDVSATNEVTGGAEADVDGAGAGDDVECNAADGLPCPETTTPKL